MRRRKIRVKNQNAVAYSYQNLYSFDRSDFSLNSSYYYTLAKIP